MHPTDNIRTSNRHGFTIVELLIVVAIIAIIAAISIPPLQRAREVANQSFARSNVRMICQATRLFLQEFNRLPNDIRELKDEGYTNIPIHRTLPDGSAIISNGYVYQLIFDENEMQEHVTFLRTLGPEAEDIVAAIVAAIGRLPNSFLVFARPALPGRTGCKLIYCVDGAFFSVTDPDCEEVQLDMFLEIWQGGLRAAAVVLRSDPDGNGKSIARDVLPALRAADTTQDVFDFFDRDGNGKATFAELKSASQTKTATATESDGDALAIMQGYLQWVLDDAMQVGAEGEDVDDVGVTFDEWTGDPAALFSFENLCDLTWASVSKKGVAKAMCAKLEDAAAAEAEGDIATRDEDLDAYQNQRRAQTGKSLTEEDSAILDFLIEVRKPNDDF